jgi:hydrogenase expression/formation protein HypE
LGKLAAKELQKMLDCIKKDFRVIIPPTIGYDAGVHLLNGKYVAVATDPCTGVPEEWFGWLMINYAASDVALFGAKPEFCTVNLLGPLETKPEVFQKIMEQTCKAADELGVAIVRGHTGMYGSLTDILGVCTIYGTVEPKKLITPGNAKPHDMLLCVKPLGLETIINFSLTHKEKAQELFGIVKQEELVKLVCMQSCVKEATELARIEGVHAMHDATEGGFVASLNELSQSSKVGFKLYWEKLPLTKEILILRDHFELSDEQMLAMSSTGTILASVSPLAQRKVEAALERFGHCAYFLGKFTEKLDRIIIREGKETRFPVEAQDPYTTILSSK